MSRLLACVPFLSIWGPGAFLALYLKHVMMEDGGYMVPYRSLGRLRPPGTAFGDMFTLQEKLTLFRSDILVATLVVPGLAVALLSFLRHRLRAPFMAVVTLALMLVMYAQIIALKSVGTLLSFQSIKDAVEWGLAHPGEGATHVTPGSIEQSDGVTAVSKYLMDKTLSNYNIDKEIEVIPNFIDTGKYNRDNATKKGCYRKNYAPDGAKILIHTSNFRPVKRVQDVIKIFAKVREKIPAVLILVGDGPDRGDCERLCREMGIFEHVKFLGKQDSIAEILSIADLFLMPSQAESFGLSALEAMSCEVPVISSSVGGLPELNLHNETGFRSAIGDYGYLVRSPELAEVREAIRIVHATK